MHDEGRPEAREAASRATHTSTGSSERSGFNTGEGRYLLAVHVRSMSVHAYPSNSALACSLLCLSRAGWLAGRQEAIAEGAPPWRVRPIHPVKDMPARRPPAASSPQAHMAHIRSDPARCLAPPLYPPAGEAPAVCTWTYYVQVLRAPHTCTYSVLCYS